MLARQFSAAWERSAAVISTMTSFSASAKVAAPTSGPTGAAVPNAGGEPGTGSAAGAAPGAGGVGSPPAEATAGASSAAQEVMRNSRRDPDMVTPFLTSSPTREV